MRLLIWNANYACHRRTFEQNADHLFREHADLVILSEVAQPSSLAAGRGLWIGEKGKPGLAVMAGPDYTIAPSELNANAPPLFGAFKVRGALSFNLLAVWPVDSRAGAYYNKLLDEALDVFGDFLQGERAVMAGDFNSSSKVLAQQATHPAFVARAETQRLKSLYHHQTNEEHGQEQIPTFRFSGKGKGKYHIDYCFMSPVLLQAARIQILRGPAWESRSDHFPLQVDIDLDRVLTPIGF